MLAFSTDTFPFPLPEGHRFPAAKYRRLRERVRESLPEVGLVEAPRVARADLEAVHDPGYIDAFCRGALDPAAQRALGFPWSPGLVERTLRSCGAGGGYCVFHDVAVAARVLQRDHGIRRVLIVDTDVHHGDGTAALFAGDDTVFTFSIHGARNDPPRKPPGDLDVPLPDGTGDRDYLAALFGALPEAFARARPDAVLWIAGADPWEGDALGRMALTRDGLLERDRTVHAAATEAGLPLTVTMGGGYAPDVDDIAALHLQTVRTVAAPRSP